MTRLELFLFGSPQLMRAEQTLVVDARKTMALLAYLAVTGERHNREVLLALLWPELEPRRAQNVLRRNLSLLNKTLGGRWLIVDRDIIGLDANVEAQVDVTLFHDLAQSWQGHGHAASESCQECLRDLAHAVDLYRADFLAGFGVRNSGNFDDWQSQQAARFRRDLASVLARLVRGHSDLRQIDQALHYAQRWFALDPLHEPLHRRLMTLYAAKGDRSAALRQYQHSVRLLEEELGVLPEAETTALYERLRQESEQHRQIIAGHYAIIDGDTAVGLKRNLLGSGGMGDVYRGINTQTGETVAIKALRPEIVANKPDLVQRFIREGEALRRLNHPNIVKILAASEEEGQHYLVLEYVDGGSLQELIAAKGPLSSERVLDIALDLADALTRAHRLKIVHRDLKPANILLAADGTPRLTDFGIARLVESSQLTESGLILGTVNYLSPEELAGQSSNEQSDIWSFGVILFEMLTGEQPFRGESIANVITAVLTQPVPSATNSWADAPGALVHLIERMLVKDPLQRIPSVRLVGAELEAIMADRPLPPHSLPTAAGPPPPSPYRGLAAFREEDAHLFFGREIFSRQLYAEVSERALIAVVGPSGSGKSSVVFAGLLPQIRSDAHWIVVTFRPGSDPYQGLAAGLLPLLDQDLSETDRLVETRKLANSLHTGGLALVDVVDSVLQKSEQASRLLLIADQFEELYTLTPSNADRHLFLDLLMDIVALQPFQRHPNFTFVFTLRADFLEQVLAYRPLADALQDANFILGPMIREELSRAIEDPASGLGVTFEPGLVERILDDVGEEPGNLPLLEFALSTLWERQQARVLSHSDYQAIGRVSGALTRHADETLTGLEPAAQETARRIFVQLVRPGEGTEDTRRIAGRDEFDTVDWRLVQRMADARLITTGRSALGNETVEIIHEALIRSWGSLQEWMAADRTFRLWQDRLRAAEKQWQTSKRDEGALLRGIPLGEAEGWLAERARHLSDSEREFIRASIARRDRREAEREQARLARGRLRQQITAGAITGLLIALALAALAGIQWREADRERGVAIVAQATAAAGRDQAQTAVSRQLAALTSTRLQEHLDLALLLSVEATLIADTGEGRSILRDALVTNPRLLTYFWGHTDLVNSVAFSPDGNIIASGSNDNTVILWDVATGRPGASPLQGHTDNVLSLAFSPDGQILASAGSDKSIRLWDMSDQQPLGSPLMGHQTSVGSVTFSPDGRTLASSGDKTIILWDMTTVLVENGPGVPAATLTGHEDVVRTVAFSPDGQTLVSGSNDKTVMLWDVSSGEPLGPPLTGHTDLVRSVALSPDGRWLASASENGQIFIWDMRERGVLVRKLDGHTSSVRSVTFSTDNLPGTNDPLLASAGTDGAIILWNVSTGQPYMSPLLGHTDWVRAVAFSPDGRLLASASHDRTVMLWDITSPDADALVLSRPMTGHPEGVLTVAFSPDGQTLASGSSDESVMLWDVASGQSRRSPLTGHSEGVLSVAFSPDGQTLASGSNDTTILLWDVSSGERLGAPLTGHTQSVHSVAFSPDGQMLASGSSDMTILLWDVTSGNPLGAPLAGHTEDVRAVTFSPNGRFLASAGNDNHVILWDLSADPQLSSILAGHTDIVFSVDFSPDSQTVASSSWDKTIILWDVASGEPIGPPLSGHTESVQKVVFSPDGLSLASGSWDESVILWNSATGLPITSDPPLIGHTGSVRGLVYSPDGQLLASAGDDGTIQLWDVSLSSWRALACRRANRNLSRSEWQQFFGDQPYRATCPELVNPQ